MSTSSLHIVSSQPLPASSDLHIVDSQPLPDNRGTVQKAGDFVADTFSKTAHNMNIGNVLDSLSKIDDAFKQGGIHDAIDKAREAGVRPSDFVSSLYDKIRGGDYSGAAADIIPFAFGAEGATGKATEAAGAAAEATANAARTAADYTGAAVKGAATNAGEHGLATVASAALGHPHLAAGILARDIAQGAIPAIKAKIAERAAAADAAAMDARVAAQRANPRPSLADQAGIQPEPPVSAPPIEPIVPAAPTARALVPAGPPPAIPIPPGRVPLWQQKGIQAEPPLSVPPIEPMQPPPRAPRTATPVVAATTPVADPALLDGISQSLTKKPFAKLNAQEQATVQSLASKATPKPVETPTARSISAPEAANRAAKVNEVSPMVQHALEKNGLTADDLERPEVRAVLKKSLGISEDTIDAVQAKLRPAGTPVAVRSGPAPLEPEDYSDLLKQSLDNLGYKTLADFGRKK